MSSRKKSSSRKRDSLSRLNLGNSETNLDLEDQGFVTFGGFRNCIEECDINISVRDQRKLWSYMQDNYVRSRKVALKDFYPMFKMFLLQTPRQRSLDLIRKKCNESCNFWTLDALCGLKVDPTAQTKKSQLTTEASRELDRLQRSAQRLPTDVNEADTRKRDWLFQRYDIGKTGRLVMAAVDNMMHVQFGEIAYDVKDVVRAAFRATKLVSTEESSSYNQIERAEFRLLLLALRSHLELYIAFAMIDSSGDKKLDYEEFCKALPLLQKWGVDVEDPRALFEMVDQDHSGEVTFGEFVNWALKEAIIADLELRERLAQKVNVADTVLLMGDNAGMVGRVVGWNKKAKKWIVEVENDDGTVERILLDNTEFASGCVTEEVLPQQNQDDPIKWFESLQREVMPGTKDPWMTDVPIHIKSTWSTRPKDYHHEARAKFQGDEIITRSWAKSFKEAKRNACKFMKEKIENHPAVKMAVNYVNSEKAKEREVEHRIKDQLVVEKEQEEEVVNNYRANIWRREIIGNPELDLQHLTLIFEDVGAKLTSREVNIVFRHCSQGGRDMVSIYDIDEFIDIGKHLNRQQKSLQAKIKKSYSKRKWKAFVERADPEQVEEHLAEFDASIPAPTHRFNAHPEPEEDCEYEENYNDIQALDLEAEENNDEYVEDVPEEEFESVKENAEDWEVNDRDWGVNERTPTPPPVVEQAGNSGLSVMHSIRSKDKVIQEKANTPKKKKGVAKITRKQAGAF